MKILIVRFRQLGDTVLSTPLFNTLHATFPEASIDLVLNDRIAPLLAGHPAIRRIHAFSEAERHNMARYLPRVWQIVHREHYDVIIDQFTTFYSQLFALFSPSTRYRIAVDKWYSRLMSNYTLPKCGRGSMVDHNINMAAPLEAIRPLQHDRHISLSITARELESMRSYLEGCGLDLSRPIILMGVTAKLSSKTWAEDRMAWVIDRFTGRYPDAQIIFNYAPGAEETNARRIYNRLADGRNVFIDVQTRSPRELFALAHFICFYFGNEGGARHIVHAAGKPSLVICAPNSLKSTWIPQDEVPAEGVSADDFGPTDGLPPARRYDMIDKEEVWRRLEKAFSLLPASVCKD